MVDMFGRKALEITTLISHQYTRLEIISLEQCTLMCCDSILINTRATVTATEGHARHFLFLNKYGFDLDSHCQAQKSIN